MPKIIDIRFHWLAGTMNQLRFHYEGRTFTVMLKDLQWMQGRFSCDSLYLSGSANLKFSLREMNELLAYLKQPAHLQGGLEGWSERRP